MGNKPRRQFHLLAQSPSRSTRSQRLCRMSLLWFNVLRFPAEKGSSPVSLDIELTRPGSMGKALPKGLDKGPGFSDKWQVLFCMEVFAASSSSNSAVIAV